MILVGAGEMAVQRVDGEAVERSRSRRAKAEPVHAGIDHHVAGAARRDFLPPRDLFERVEARPGARRQRGFGIVRTDAVQHEQAAPSGKSPSASASAQVDTKKSRQPAS